MNLMEQLKSLNVPIERLETDSRRVRPGDTFVACPGEKQDGRGYIAQAVAQGANAVIWESHGFEWKPEWKTPNLGIEDLRHKTGWLADEVCGRPSEKLHVVGVTGTNGKTSTSHWIAQALNEAGKRCALIGTLGNGFMDRLAPTANTTPDAITVHGLFASYLAAGAEAVAMEVSSHALAQGRVNGVRFDIAMLTNLSRDHLDYHGDMESYAASKRKLFDWESLRAVVLNLDDAYGANLAEELAEAGAEVIGYGLGDEALRRAERLGIRMVYGRVQRMDAAGMKIAIHSSWGGSTLESELLGKFNAENLLGVLGVLLASGIELQAATESLGHVRPVAGRMQRIGGAGKPTVVVDYAHTPDALEKVLKTLRASTAGKLVCVFGCGGDRDRGKRAMMGLVASRFADHSIVTSDNPRSEDPVAIIEEVVAGMRDGSHECIVERGEAIERAIAVARGQDTVLIAGKGHEDYQEIAGVKHPFSDAERARLALESWRAAA